MKYFVAAVLILFSVIPMILLARDAVVFNQPKVWNDGGTTYTTYVYISERTKKPTYYSSSELRMWVLFHGALALTLSALAGAVLNSKEG